MSKITIYNPKGEELKTLLPKGFVKKKLMSDDYVQLEWNSTTYKTLVAGCYIVFDGERYTLLDKHTPTMKDELECRYEPKFERLTWRKYPMLYIEEGIEESEFVIDGKINIALTHIIKSIKKATGEIWQYVTDYNLTDNRFLSFDNFDIISALNHIAEVWECEWWIEGKEIHFGQCKLGDRIDLRVGEHIKVPSHTDFESYYSKFRVFGSDKNIEQHQSDANVSARSRLTLPDTYENSTIVVDEDTDYTTTVVFDEVYPKSFLEISEVQDNNLIKLKDFDLKDEDVIEGKTPEIHFSSGLLEGRDFELESYGEWLVLVEQGDELKFPNDVVKPKVGDSVVLWNIKMPDEYIQEARIELEKEALDYISDLKVDNRQYTARTNRVKFPYLDLVVGQNAKYLKVGHQGLEYGLDVRVLGFEFDLENRRDGTIIFGNELAKGSIETLKEQIDKIKEQPKAKGGTSVIVKDVLESTDDLPINPKNGDAYWVGSILYIWNGFTWVTSDLKGDKGEQPYIEEVNGVKYWFIGGVNTWVKAKGEDGKDGDTPYIGQNGNWWIGGKDTGQKAEGEDGTSPYIGENGNWWFGTTDTGVQAKANDGKSPYIGTNGNWFIWDAAQNKFVDSGDTSVGDDGKSPEIRDGYWWAWNGTKWYNTGVKAKGEDGKDGDTPYIGQNGNWWIGGKDTGQKAEGEDGTSPYIGENGNWWFGTTDTGVQAKANDGKSPYIGTNGNWFIWDAAQNKFVDSGDTSVGDDGKSPEIRDGYWWAWNGTKWYNTGVKAKGEDGKDGDTPYIGQNGNWWIGGKDTGQKAEGEDGTSPYIGENGNWWFGTTDTGVQAKANDGKSPYIGTNGNWFIWDAAQNKFVDSGDTSVGDDGKSPEIRDGYWWAWNGTKWYNTGVKAKGEDGKDGVDGDTPYIGYNGNWWIGDEDTGVNPDGKAGPMLVQEGIYSSSVTYVADAVKKPLVFQPDNDLTPRIGKYYYPINVGEYTNISPKDNPSVWAVAEDYQVVLTDTLVALFAKVGGAVFYGDYMISQYGKDNNGMESKDYDKFPDEFTPNLLLDFKSGEIIAHKGTFSGNLKGVSGTFKELYVLDNRGNEAGKITFGQDGSFTFTGSIFFNDSVIFDGNIHSQGNITQQGKTLVNDLIARGAFGYGQKAAIVVSGSSAKYYYEGYGDNKPYLSRFLGVVGSGGAARYEIPIHTRDFREDNGYVYNLIYFDPVETHYKYEIIGTRIGGNPYPVTPNVGYEVTLANVDDSNNNIAVFINGDQKRWNGGAIGKLNFIGKLQQPNALDRVGGGWLLEYFYDNDR